MASRRERYREETRGEIRAIALRQIEESGPDGLSLNAIGRAMGMSGPAIYRYYGSRDELISELIVEGYEDLSEALEAAAASARRRSARARLHALGEAYRAWGLANPHRYSLMFGGRRPPGYREPERVVPASQRSMVVFLDALADLAPDDPQRVPGALARQLSAWGSSRDPSREFPPAVLRLGVAAWTRLHGVVSLDLGGVFDALEVDAAAFLAAELDDLVEDARR